MTEHMTAAEYRFQTPKKGNKYGAKRTNVDGIWFDSKAEARRYSSLRLLEKAGRIDRLELQPKFDLCGPNGDLICTYKADFQYTELGEDRQPLGSVVEDVKSPATASRRDYKLTIKLLLSNFPFLDFREVAG